MVRCLILLSTIIPLALSVTQVLRQEDIDGYQVTIYTEDSNTFIKAMSLDTGAIWGPTQIYQNYTNSAILANINRKMIFNGTEGTSVFFIPPMYDKPVELENSNQSSEQKQYNLLQYQTQNLQKDISKLKKMIEDLNVTQNALNNNINNLTIDGQEVFARGSLAKCAESYKPVSCSCGSGCGSYDIQDSENQCHCQCGEWTQAHCIKIIT